MILALGCGRQLWAKGLPLLHQYMSAKQSQQQKAPSSFLLQWVA
jgi:hypothetical protein